MSDKEVLRGQLIAQLIEGRLDQKSVAARLSISVRQVKCLKRNYAKEGIAGLISKKRGQVSNRRTPQSVIGKAMTLIGTRYYDFGSTFASEKLA